LTRPGVRAVRCDRIDLLTDPDFLSTVVGPVRAVERSPIDKPSGFSGASHERFHLILEDDDRVSLVLKRTRLDEEWTAYRSDDTRGREALLLDSREVAEAWSVFASPYVAFARETGEIGLLMHDLEPYLLPDVREPIAIESEDAILSRLARLHAIHWERPLPEWLAKTGHHLSLVGPINVGHDPRRPPPAAMLERVREGWLEVFRRVPAPVARLLRTPEQHEERFAALPHTLIHGDAKVANFAFLPGHRIGAFDWAMAGHEPVSIEIGWYLAVNASRLARSKEAVLERYRELLETALGRPLPSDPWEEIRAAAFLAGAIMLLWTKALAVRDGRAGAEAELDWWVERISEER
jgi:hypothetical protein